MKFPRDNIARDVSGRIALVTALIHLLFAGAAPAAPRSASVVKNIWAHIVPEDFDTLKTDQRCHGQDRYRVYLIDNFEQRVDLVPEVLTSLGEIAARHCDPWVPICCLVAKCRCQFRQTAQ